MRISAHNLNIETGRFYNLDRHERVCSMCNLNVVEDEYHFILQCEKYIDIHFTNKVILHSLFKFTYKKIYMVNILRYPDIT
jgi:hypothetical protein